MLFRTAGLMPWLMAASAALALLASRPDVVHAKTPGWVITGGDLGEYAMMFYAETDAEYELSTFRGQRVVEPPADPGQRYDIHTDGWLSPEYYARAASYYPTAGLLYGHTWDDPVDRWMQPDSVTIGMLDRAIATAKARMAAGELERGVVAATFRSRGMDEAVYTFTPHGPSTLDGPPRFGIGASTGDGDFAMIHLAETLEHGASGRSAEVPHYQVSIQGRGWAGGTFFYALPDGDQPGRYFPPNSYGFEPDNTYYRNTYYETTPGFDAFILELIDDALGERRERASLQSSDHDATSPDVHAAEAANAVTPAGDGAITANRESVGASGASGFAGRYTVLGTIAAGAALVVVVAWRFGARHH